jgi:hypothetical protein
LIAVAAKWYQKQRPRKSFSPAVSGFADGDESEKIFDVNKKYSERISKSFSNRVNINHKEDDTWSIYHIAEQNLRWEDDWSKRIKKILESKIRESQVWWSFLFMRKETLIQRLFLSDREHSFDWMKIERRNYEENWKNSRNEFTN